MLMNQAMNVMEKLVNEIKESPPEDRDHFMKIALSFVEMGIESFRTSPEFRRGLLVLVDKEIRTYLEQS